MTALPLPVREPKQITGVNLSKRQVHDLDTVAAAAGMGRSALIRWLIDRALPLAQVEVVRAQIAVSDDPLCS